MTKYELLGRLSLLLGAAGHLPNTSCVMGYSPFRQDHDGLPAIFVEHEKDLPEGERLPVEPVDAYFVQHAVMCRGVKVYCYGPRQEGNECTTP